MGWESMDLLVSLGIALRTPCAPPSPTIPWASRHLIAALVQYTRVVSADASKPGMGALVATDKMRVTRTTCWSPNFFRPRLAASAVTRGTAARPFLQITFISNASNVHPPHPEVSIRTGRDHSYGLYLAAPLHFLPFGTLPDVGIETDVGATRPGPRAASLPRT